MVPAYNEEATIRDVVSGLAGIAGSELIVVDDGSSDDTARRAREAGARVISLGRRSGKGQALAAGVVASSHPLLVFLDADVRGMTEEKVLALVRPVQEGAIMCVGVRFAFYNHLNNAFPWLPVLAKLSGQRCVDRVLWEAARPYCTGYGVESSLNLFASRLGRIAYIHLPGLTHTIKESKRGLARGLLERSKMIAQVVYYSLRLRIRRPPPLQGGKSRRALRTGRRDAPGNDLLEVTPDQPGRPAIRR